ncbi:IMP dehydrogenase [Patescibacteria group bacterium]|nr:IMP dehydrogenase [Patescibacteria group bacterium]
MKPLSTYLSFVPSRSQIDLKTQITPSLKLNLPLIAINMDTVTGPDMATAISKPPFFPFDEEKESI